MSGDYGGEGFSCKWDIFYDCMECNLAWFNRFVSWKCLAGQMLNAESQKTLGFSAFKCLSITLSMPFSRTHVLSLPMPVSNGVSFSGQRGLHYVRHILTKSRVVMLICKRMLKESHSSFIHSCPKSNSFHIWACDLGVMA